MAHLRLVHDTAVDLVAAIGDCFPTLDFDAAAVVLGAAIHDLGKVLHPNELTRPGNRHEEDGPALLERHGFPPVSAPSPGRMGVGWDREETLALKDLLVALADALWKGRCHELEGRVVQRIATMISAEPWQAFLQFDHLAKCLAVDGQERLAWQQRF